MEANKKFSYLFGISLVGILVLLSFVFAIAPTWTGSDVNYSTSEDANYYHNLSANITGFNADVTFAINTNTIQYNITVTNSTGVYNLSKENVAGWLLITNANNGNLTLNATYDNQSGYFTVPIQAKNTTDDEATTTIFEFIANATNDAPNFTNINNTYNFTSIADLSEFLNATDEEGHYPLNFSVVFNSTYCTHASWSGYADNTSCSLYDFGLTLTNTSNTSALLDFTPTNNYVGVYYANISVRDYGENYNSSAYPFQDASYSQNQTTYYSTDVTFNIFAALTVNVSQCQDMVLQQGGYGACNVTIRTKGSLDDLNISTYSVLRNYIAGQSGVLNTSWFHANETAATSNFEYNVTINVTPGITEIGNWTINFTVNDTTYSESNTSEIHVYVNRTSDDAPTLAAISDVTTSVNLATSIDLTVDDDDFLIPDKNDSYGGFNETSTFNVTILNQSNLAQTLSITGFDINVTQMPVSGTNRTAAQINFTPTTSDIGDYTINITVNDSEDSMTFGLFNLSIINNSAPSWDGDVNTTWYLVEDINFYLNLSQNVSDDDGDALTFLYTNDTAFANFNLSVSTGEVNFTPRDADVGGHVVNITVSDGYLTDTQTFLINVTNVNDEPLIRSITTSSGGSDSTITNTSTYTTWEDNYTTISLFLEDDDYRIPSGQSSYYSENLTVNVTIEGPNTDLFNFSYVGIVGGTVALENRSEYDAIFIPNKTDVGDYNITLNVTDQNNVSTFWTFNLSVTAIDHYPSLTASSNQTYGVNQTLYYDLNVSDTEDGNDTSGTLNSNFTFVYTNLSGNNIFSSYFNSTTGIFNVTFNDSQSGLYHLNVTVNDSGGKENSTDFWILVYGLPSINSPDSGYVFNLTENTASVLNFTANHSILDNLTYVFKVDSITYNGSYSYGNLSHRHNLSYYGDNTGFNWSFTPNFTDETYGLLKNITLTVYPSSSDLENNTNFNVTRTFKVNVTHTNSNVTFSGDISDKGPVSYGTDITVDLSGYFSDLDYSDEYYNQSVSFTVSSNESTITSSVSSAWVLTLSSSSATVELMNVTASDGSSSAVSNNFLVQFIAPTVTSGASTGSGGGGTRDIPVSFKLILPDPVSAFQNDTIRLPITLKNTGQNVLRGIHLSATVAKNGVPVENIGLMFSDDSVQVLEPGEEYNITLTANINTKEVGLYEITVTGKVDNPVYTDWGKIYLTVKEGTDVEERILFTEEFIVSNPECLELTEMVDEAKALYAQGRTTDALAKAEEALDACKNAIAQAGRADRPAIIEDKLYRYAVGSMIAAMILGVAFYSYKRIKLKRKQRSFIQQDIKNRKFLDYGAKQYG